MTTALTDYLTAGWALVPIPRGEKSPKLPGWNRPENAITDPSQLAQLRGMNVGLLHAYCTPTPTCALDVDHFKKARAWLAAQGIDLFGLLNDPDALVITSGKPQSIKALYRLPDGCGALTTAQFRGDDGAMLFELRCAYQTGRTAQDVLPPSVHTSGRQYVWANPANTDPSRMPILPACLLEVWRTHRATSGGHLRRPPGQPSTLILNGMPAPKIADPEYTAQAAEVSRRLAAKVPPADTPHERCRLLARLRYLPANCDRDRWRDLVWAILSTGWHDAVEIAYAWSVSAPEKFKEGDFVGVVNSFDPDKIGGITYGTLCHHATEAGYHE